MYLGLQHSGQQIATDSPYNNTPEVTRTKASSYNKEQLRYDICMNVKPKLNHEEKPDFTLALQTNLSDSELSLPVRNMYCPDKPDCLWSQD